MDQTKELQAYFDSGTVPPQGDYYVNPDVGVTVKTGADLDLTGVRIVSLPSSKIKYSLVKIYGVTDVIIKGLTVIGDKDRHIGEEGEWGFGFDIRNSSNIQLIGVAACNCWGDGLYVSAVVSLLVRSSVFKENRRQGITVVDGQKLEFTKCLLFGNKGASPGFGIDLEANANCKISEVKIDCCDFIENAGGLNVSCPVKNATTSSVGKVTITGCLFKGTGSGLQVSDSSDVVADSCNFAGNSKAVYITGGTTVDVKGCSLSGNKGPNTVLVKRSRYVLITSNTFKENVGIGINAQLSLCVGIAGNKITGQKRNGNNSDCGYLLSGNTELVVGFNTATDCDGYGFVIDTTVPESNKAVRCKLGGVRLVKKGK